MGKKVLYSMALASALMLGACSSNSDLEGGGSNNGAAKASYVSININNVGAAPTGRASYKAGDGTYEDGVGIENAINNVRFYFFNADGTPYLLNSAGNDAKVNYLDVELKKNGNDPDHTIETITNTVLVLNGESSLAPASMLAVVNPEAAGNLLGNSSQRFSVLRTSTEGSKWNDDKGFVMSNSVYKEAGTDVCSTQLGGKLYTNAVDATNHPVDVYVERVLAKVGANVNTTNGNWSQVTEGSYKDTWKIKVGTLQLAQDEGSKTVDVYAWIQGWGVADANGKAELCKQIKVANWTDETLGIKPWNTADYHRCFWSNSCPVSPNDNPLVNQNFNSYKERFDSTLYAMPNTPDAEVPNPTTSKNDLTKVLVAAKLGYQDGETWKPAEICEYKGQEFLGISNLKKVLLNETKKYYTKATRADGDVYENMTADNITFTTEDNYNVNLKDYQVVPELKDVTKLYRVADDELMTSNPNSANVAYVEVSVDEVNKELAQNPAEIRTDGDAYYYTPIKHLGKAGTLGEYGVVRNHSYKITIDDIKGWGTPVYDPDKVIIPTLPSNEKTYLAARVNVLSWRVVSSNVNLDQTNK